MAGDDTEYKNVSAALAQKHTVQEVGAQIRRRQRKRIKDKNKDPQPQTQIKPKGILPLIQEYVDLLHERTVIQHLMSHLSGYISTEIGEPKVLRCDSKIAPVVDVGIIIDVRGWLADRVVQINERLKELE